MFVKLSQQFEKKGILCRSGDEWTTNLDFIKFIHTTKNYNIIFFFDELDAALNTTYCSEFLSTLRDLRNSWDQHGLRVYIFLIPNEPD